MASESMAKDPIKHVVLLMLENHSFDEMLGCYQAMYPHLEGVDKNLPPRTNADAKGKLYKQQPKKALFMRYDPKHEHEDVQRQLEGGNAGFIKDFVSTYPSSTDDDKNNIMGYYEWGFLPALHALADDFTICDHWFSSLPGPTWPNRFFALSGTSSGKVLMPEGFEKPNIDTILAQTQPTIFDRLSEKGKSWKIYYYDFPSSLIFKKLRQPKNLENYEHINKFFSQTDIRLGDAGLPDFSFIEPKYFGIDQNDDHPPHNLMKAEKLIADVYNALRTNEDLWKTTLLVVVFDEHGGFYDHVPPPVAVAPDDKKDEYDFSRLGVRVPALLVSPWVDRTVLQTQFDHTSLLKYLTDKWGLDGLGERAAKANSIGAALNQEKPRTDTISFIRVPYSDLVKTSSAANEYASSQHQNALHVLGNFIGQELQGAKSTLASDAVGAAARISRLWIKISASLAKKLHNMGDRLLNKSNNQIAQTESIIKDLFIAMKGEPYSE